MSLVSVAIEDLALGTPLPWMVQDPDGKVLMNRGEVLDTEEQLHVLLLSNPLRDLCSNPGPSASLRECPAPPAEDFEADRGAAEGARFTFQDMKLRVGERIQLQPPATVSTDRHVVKLLGYLDNVSVMVTAPIANGQRLPLMENDMVVARVFSSQKVFGFSSTVHRVCKSPYDYLHLSFPDRIQGSVIRKAPRVKTKIIASIARPDAADGGDRQSGVIVNLSANGALVQARQPIFRKEQRLRLSFRVTLHEVGAYLTVDAAIRSVYAAEEAGSGAANLVNLGVQFLDLPAADRAILQSLIYQQMIEQPNCLA